MEIPLPIIAALTAALVSGGFSVLTLIVVSKNEKRKRREEARLRHLQRQIEELYGPLYGLIQFGAAINELEWLRLPKESRDEKGWPRDEQGGKALQFFREHYYLPLNQQIVELIRTKVYLLNSDGIPDSFAKFIRHAAQLDSLHRLWTDANIRTPRDQIKVIEYPNDFKSEVESTLNELRNEYNNFTEQMKGRRRLALVPVLSMKQADGVNKTPIETKKGHREFTASQIPSSLHLLISAILGYTIFRLITTQEIIVALGTIIFAVSGMRLLGALSKAKFVVRVLKDYDDQLKHLQD